jgi:P27 family predicted phage terminase small subunit
MPGFIDTRKKVGRGKVAVARAAAMSNLSQQVWDHVHGELSRLNLVQRLDETALGIFCRAVAEYAHCNVELDRDGMHYEARSYANAAADQPVQILKRLHPAFQIRREAIKVIRDQSDVLGLNPRARQQLFLMLANRGIGGALPLESPDDILPKVGDDELQIGFMGLDRPQSVN